MKLASFVPIGVALGIFGALSAVQSIEQEAEALGFGASAKWLHGSRWWLSLCGYLIIERTQFRRRISVLEDEVCAAAVPQPDPIAEEIRWLENAVVIFATEEVSVTRALYALRRNLERGMTLRDWDVAITAPIPPPAVQLAVMRAKADWLGSYYRRENKPRDLLFDLCMRELIKKGDPPADSRNGPELYTALPKLRQVFRRLEEDPAFAEIIRPLSGGK